MSLVQILLQPDEAYVAVDTRTAGFVPGSVKPKIYEGTKMIPLLAAQVIFTIRGDGHFLRWVFNHFSTNQGSLDFDAIAESLEDVVRRCALGYQAALSRQGLRGADRLGNEICAVGWSQRTQSMGCVLVLTKGHSVQSSVRKNGVIGPALSAPLDARTMLEDGEFIRRARQQVEVAAAEDPAMPIGGRLLLARLTRTELSVRDLGEI